MNIRVNVADRSYDIVTKDEYEHYGLGLLPGSESAVHWRLW